MYHLGGRSTRSSALQPAGRVYTSREDSYTHKATLISYLSRLPVITHSLRASLERDIT